MRQFNCCSIVVIVAICTTLVFVVQSSPSVRITSVSTTANPVICKSKVSFNYTTANFEAVSNATINKLRLNLQINAKNRHHANDRFGEAASSNYTNMINETVDFCDYLQHPLLYPVLNSVWQEFMSSSRTNMRSMQCPIEAVC